MNDLIDRQAAIEAHCELCGDRDKCNCDICPDVEVFQLLPSAQPERKKGRWIPVTNGRGGFECDGCHNYAPSFQDGVEWLSDYCPNCGARMEGEEE